MFEDGEFPAASVPVAHGVVYEHLGSMLGGGIAFHTAFLVLGAGRLFRLQLDGPAAVIPWLLPTLVGVPASAYWTRYYRRKFKETERSRWAMAWYTSDWRLVRSLFAGHRRALANALEGLSERCAAVRA